MAESLELENIRLRKELEFTREKLNQSEKKLQFMVQKLSPAESRIPSEFISSASNFVTVSSLLKTKTSSC